MAFRWSNITKGISKELAREANLRVSKSEEDLRARFGEPPREELVKELWPVLLDRWLGTQPRWREQVVEQLRAARLGDSAIKVSTKAGQMSYLRSCRASLNLRATVLKAFIAAGQHPMVPPSVMVGTDGDTGPEEPKPRGRKQGSGATRPPAGGELGLHVGTMLEEMLGAKPLVDEDGDFNIGFGSTVIFVRAEAPEDDIPAVQAFATLVSEVKPSAALFSDLNEINLKLRFGKVEFNPEGFVSIVAVIPAVSLEIVELDAIMEEIAHAGDYFDTILSQKHGGATMGRDAGDVIDA